MGYKYQQLEAGLPKPINDADTAIEWKVTEAICRRAEGHETDPYNCALSQAAKTGYGRKLVGTQVLGSVAFVELKDEIIRFSLPQRTRQAIAQYDRGEGFPVGKYRFEPIPPSLSREALRVRREQLAEQRAALAGAKGRRAKKQAERIEAAKPKRKVGAFVAPRGRENGYS